MSGCSVRPALSRASTHTHGHCVTLDTNKGTDEQIGQLGVSEILRERLQKNSERQLEGETDS